MVAAVEGGDRRVKRRMRMKMRRSRKTRMG